MAAQVAKDTCVGCGACTGECPCDAIELVDGVATVNDNCVSCGACADACPAGAITVE